MQIIEKMRVNAELKRITPAKDGSNEIQINHFKEINPVKIETPFNVKSKPTQKQHTLIQEEENEEEKEHPHDHHSITILKAILDTKTEEYKLKCDQLQDLKQTLESVSTPIPEIQNDPQQEVVVENAVEEESNNDIEIMKKFKEQFNTQFEKRYHII